MLMSRTTFIANSKKVFLQRFMEIFMSSLHFRSNFSNELSQCSMKSLYLVITKIQITQLTSTFRNFSSHPLRLSLQSSNAITEIAIKLLAEQFKFFSFNDCFVLEIFHSFEHRPILPFNFLNEEKRIANHTKASSSNAK